MGYLDRLKGIVSEKCPPCELPKVPKAPYDSFDSSQGARIQKREAANLAPIVGAGDAATGSTAPADARIEKALAKLHGDPGLRYAAEVHIDATPDAVILTLAIRDKAACELHIPREKYDSFLLLELIERHSGTVQ